MASQMNITDSFLLFISSSTGKNEFNIKNAIFKNITQYKSHYLLCYFDISFPEKFIVSNLTLIFSYFGIVLFFC